MMARALYHGFCGAATDAVMGFVAIDHDETIKAAGEMTRATFRLPTQRLTPDLSGRALTRDRSPWTATDECQDYRAGARIAGRPHARQRVPAWLVCCGAEVESPITSLDTSGSWVASTIAAPACTSANIRARRTRGLPASSSAVGSSAISSRGSRASAQPPRSAAADRQKAGGPADQRAARPTVPGRPAPPVRAAADDRPAARARPRRSRRRSARRQGRSPAARPIRRRRAW